MLFHRLWKRVISFGFAGRGRFYKISLSTILLITCLIGILIGSSIYWVVSGKIERELQAAHSSRLNQTSNFMNDQLNYLEMTLTHWAYDPAFGETLNDLDFIHGYNQIHDLYRTLLVMEGTHPLIKKVELILLEPSPLIFNTERYFHMKQNEQEIFTQLLERVKTIHWTSTNSSLALFHKIPGGSRNQFGFLKISLDESQMEKLLGNLDPYNQGIVFLMNESGDIIQTTEENDRDLSTLTNTLQEKLLQMNQDEGSFQFEWDRQKYSVSYGEMQRLDSTWKYVSAVSITAITQPAIDVSRMILLISGLGLIIALLLSWLASNWLYKPINKLRQAIGNVSSPQTRGQDEFEWISDQWQLITYESQSLQSRMESQMPQLRGGFMLQLVQGQLYSLNENELRERLGNYGFKVDGSTITAMVVQLVGFANPEGKFFKGDSSLVSFAAGNIMEELAKEKVGQVQIIHIQDLWVGMLLFVPPSQEMKKLELIQLGEEIISAIGNVLRMNVTISISSKSKQLIKAYELFEEAKQAISFRDLREVNQIIDAEGLHFSDDVLEMNYPLALEKQILQMLRMGEEQEISNLFSEFMNRLSENRGNELLVHQGILHLLGSIHHTIIEAGVDPYRIYGMESLYEQLKSLNDPSELKLWFEKNVVQPFFQYFRNRENTHAQQMVEKAIVLLQESYMTDISLDACANDLETTTYTLSKAFRQITGINFIDYLTQIRLEKAKQLLRETDDKVNDIAEQVGYQSSYFHRIFKKHEGMPPSRYRQMSENSREAKE